jgi:hypothetical protein
MTARTLDKYYASLILNLLTRPFDHTKAYSLGIVDSEGKLKKRPQSENEKEAYTPLHQLVFGVKRVLDMFPGSSNKIKQLAVAMNFIKNQHVPEQFKESVDANQFLKELSLVVENELYLPEEEFLVEQYLKEEGEAPAAPTVTTDAIDIHTPVIKKLFIKKKDEE